MSNLTYHVCVTVYALQPGKSAPILARHYSSSAIGDMRVMFALQCSALVPWATTDDEDLDPEQRAIREGSAAMWHVTPTGQNVSFCDSERQQAGVIQLWSVGHE
jgi:hypothetical protein